MGITRADVDNIGYIRERIGRRRHQFELSVRNANIVASLFLSVRRYLSLSTPSILLCSLFSLLVRKIMTRLSPSQVTGNETVASIASPYDVGSTGENDTGGGIGVGAPHEEAPYDVMMNDTGKLIILSLMKTSRCLLKLKSSLRFKYFLNHVLNNKSLYDLHNS